MANNKVPTRVYHNSEGVERTSPDVVLYRGSMRCSFRVLSGSEGGGGVVGG